MKNMNTEGEDLSIILHIANGTGFGLKDGKIVVTATLGGNVLEAKPVQTSDKVEFNNNLIWETNKQSIKRMKTENLPIKLECFISTLRNGQEVRNLIGYILLPIRGVPIVLHKKSMNNRPHWHKLVGLSSEWKLKKPEVSLHLSITDKIRLSNPNYELRYAESADSMVMAGVDTIDMLSSQKGLYIQLLKDEGLIQVGEKDKNCDIFILRLLFKNARNIEEMLNPEADIHQLFRFNYNLLGTPAYCTLTPKDIGTYSIQEKIAINFRTSLSCLKEYFTKVFYIPVELFYNGSSIGSTRFYFMDVLKVETLGEYLVEYGGNNNTFNKEITFPIQSMHDLPPSAPTPFIEIAFSLEYKSTTKENSCEIIVDEPEKSEYRDNCADEKKTYETDEQNNLTRILANYSDSNKNSLEMRRIRSDLVIDAVRQTNIQSLKDESNVKSVQSGRTLNQDVPINIHTIITERCSAKSTEDVPRTFSFNFNLQTVSFNRRPETGIWQISLHHLNADTAYTIANVELTEISSNLIEFKNLELQLFFSSSVKNIFDVISAESCILKINGPRGLYAFAEIDNEILLLSTKEKRSGVILMENQNGERCAMAHIFVYMKDVGVTFNSRIKKHINSSNEAPTKPYLDDNLAYQMVEELEDWKQKQQENFLVELKRKEVNHLAALSIEWQKRKGDLETELENKVEHCTKLSETLEEAHRTLKERGVDYLEHERLTETARIEAEHRYSKIITELNEKIRRLEDDMVHQIKLEQLKYKELELEKLNVEKERLSLKHELDELRKANDDMRVNYLPREQLAGLFQDVKVLNERLEEVQKSKQFYKVQWAKIIREVHKMKSDHLHRVEDRHFCCRSTGLQNLLQSERNEFYNEREELKEVKAALAHSSDEDDCESCCEFDR